ncbi:hypothetical protein APHNP_1315 [Anaplasma phagocytophilum str. ApNP]|uniref:Uncharacterized protein n=1 Tax=Anaplasma phagocytophilum str. ApNP TaxID=1359153 RepID=A0A0F3NI25_ANAPH|nr:hypothetical protein APHNP_1315 [Anaplasma phagocytophilum str. ApNP]
MCWNKISGKTSATAHTIATDLVKAFSHPKEKTIPRHRTTKHRSYPMSSYNIKSNHQ